MSQFIDAERKITALVDLLKTEGGFDIEATFASNAVGSPQSTSDLSIELSGRDVPVLFHNNAELLQAIKHVAVRMLRLEPVEAERLRFDAAYANADKRSELERLAIVGIEIVRATSRPHRFPPMMASERRLLHSALASSGLKSASAGIGPRRGVILYPEGMEVPLEQTLCPDGSEPCGTRYTAACICA